VYVNAPNAASGPIPEDVKPYFDGPYYEWWNAEKVNITQALLVVLLFMEIKLCITNYVDKHCNVEGTVKKL